MDYWSEDFDADKNCLQENKIIELRNKVSLQHQSDTMPNKESKVIEKLQAYDIKKEDRNAPTQCSSETVGCPVLGICPS